MDVAKMLDEAARIAGLKNDAEIARALGVSRNTVHNWRHGLRMPDATYAAQIAVLQGREPIAGVAALELVRHREDAAAVKFWKSQLAGVREFIVGFFGANLLFLHAPCVLYACNIGTSRSGIGRSQEHA